MVDVTKFLQQKAVYWGTPTSDGYGGFTYADPVEIAVRWTDSVSVITGADGEEIVSKAMVMTGIDVAEQGVLWLGTLAEVDSADEDDPTNLALAYVIKRFDKIPDLTATGFLRKAFL